MAKLVQVEDLTLHLSVEQHEEHLFTPSFITVQSLVQLRLSMHPDCERKENDYAPRVHQRGHNYEINDIPQML